MTQSDDRFRDAGDELPIDDIHLICSRYVDEELDADEHAAFERRLLVEPELRARVDDARASRALFEPERRAETPRPSASFASRVLAEVRRLPTGDELREAERAADRSTHARFEAACRRLVLAATLLIALGALAFGGLLQATDSGELDASPEEIHAEMDRLDEMITERLEAEERERDGVSRRR